VIEPQDYDEYACLIDPAKILVLPFSNHGDGPGRARNWCWDHSMSLGYKRHWVCDDNIDGFMRLHKRKRRPFNLRMNIHNVQGGGSNRISLISMLAPCSGLMA
jgi:hypothetical protein